MAKEEIKDYTVYCNWCDLTDKDVDLYEHEITVHTAELRQQHLEEWGHELDGPECLHQRQREESN